MTCADNPGATVPPGTRQMEMKETLASTEAEWPSTEVLRQLIVEQRFSNQQIGDVVGVSRQAVAKHLARVGLSSLRREEDPRVSAGDLLPWRVPKEWDGSLPTAQLRLLNKQLHGRELTPAEERTLDRWVKFMDGQNAAGVPLSVHFDPVAGFVYVAREEFDTNYIHQPAENHPFLRER